MPEENEVAYHTDLRTLITEEPCDFASVIVKSWQDQENDIRGFVLDRLIVENTEINVTEVVGTNHGSYHGREWSALIMDGKKSDSNLSRLASNPEYYLSSELKEQAQYTSVDGDIYINGGGNNRTIIAKFFFHYNQDTIEEPVLKGIKLEKLYVDWQAKHAKDEIEKLLTTPQFSHLKFNLIREDLPDQKPYYRWHLYNHKLNRGIKIDRDDLVDLLKDMQADNFFSRFFGLGYSKDLRKSDVLCLR